MKMKSPSDVASARRRARLRCDELDDLYAPTPTSMDCEMFVVLRGVVQVGSQHVDVRVAFMPQLLRNPSLRNFQLSNVQLDGCG